MFAILRLLFYTGFVCQFINGIYAIDENHSGDQCNIGSVDNGAVSKNKFEPTWESLDSRPLPSWYDDAKFGIFIHWGVFSVPSFGSEWFWRYWKTDSPTGKYSKFMKERYPPNFTYQDFAKDFTAEFYDPTEWSKIIKASGAKYVVLTSKHHEGYALWPSKYSFSWNSADVGPNRDLVGELEKAIRKNTDIKFGLYHSLFEFYNPLFLADQKNNLTTDNFVKFKTLPELYELVNLYKPEIVWSDGDVLGTVAYWRSKEFLAWLYNESPVKDTVVVNDRWGQGAVCHHGDFYTCSDEYNPGVLKNHKWENCMKVDKYSWGYRRNAPLSDYLTVADLVKELVTTVSCGGNLLLNVGPTKDGIIAPIFEERLREMGDWLSVNGEAIYNSRPWRYQNDTMNGNVWYTERSDLQTVYGFILSWPKDNILLLGAPRLPDTGRIFLLGHDISKELEWERLAETVKIILPVEANRGQPAWVIRFQLH